MDNRQMQISQLNLYTDGIDKEVTMILQCLQWGRNQLLEGSETGTCTYDTNHEIPLNSRQEHEKKCSIRCEGYSTEDLFLPDPFDSDANTLVKLSGKDITQIIDNASKSYPTFKKGGHCHGPEPLSLARLQCTYTPDERRVIHDAVVSAVPSCHDLADLALLSSNGTNETDSKAKSRVEVLAELRDMRRRRAKYRGAGAGAPSARNYSHVLRELIHTQMEFYTEVQTEAKSTAAPQDSQTNKEAHNSQCNDNIKSLDNGHSKHNYEAVSSHRREHKREAIKLEQSKERRIEHDSRSSRREEKSRGRSERDKTIKERSRDRRHDDYDRRASRREDSISERDRSRDRRRDSYEGHSNRRNRDKYESYKEDSSRREEKYNRHHRSYEEDHYRDRKKLK